VLSRNRGHAFLSSGLGDTHKLKAESLTDESFARYAYTVKTLGQKIRERREELDLSLREFAKKLDCSPPFISDVEHGRRFPSDGVLEEMARLLKLDLAELKRHDPRAPLDEIKRMTEQDPGYAFAFRTLVEKKLTPDELVKLANKARPPPKGGEKK
jgi:transcriptional regulator with XRE-family HTH domain